MLKKIVASIITLIMIFSLAGCGDVNIEMLRKLNETSKWEAVQNKEDIKLTFNYQDKTYTIELSTDNYSKNKEIQSEGNIILKTLDINGFKLDLTSGEYRISPIKFYSDKFKFYLETTGIKEIFTKLGIPVPSQLEPSYVGIDMNQEVEEQLKILGMTDDELVEVSDANIEEIIKLNVDFPVNKTDNVYSIKLNDEEIVKLLVDFIIESYTMKGGAIDQLGVTGIEKDQMLAKIQKTTRDSYKLIEDSLKGSNLDVKFNISDNSIDSKIYFDFKFNNGVEQVGVLVDATSKISKADIREIEFPKEAKLYNIDELISKSQPELSYSSVTPAENQVVIINSADLKNIDGDYYVPAKLVFNKVGIQLIYSPKTKQVSANLEGQEIPIEVEIVNGTSYLKVESFEAIYGIKLQVIQ